MTRVARGWLVSGGLATAGVVALLALALGGGSAAPAATSAAPDFARRRRPDRPREVPRLPPRRWHRAVRVPDRARPRRPCSADRGRTRPAAHASVASLVLLAPVCRRGGPHPRRRERAMLVDWARASSSDPGPHAGDARWCATDTRDRTARGGVAPRSRDADRLSPSGDERLDGRLPLLPARPEAVAGRLRHVRPDRAAATPRSCTT